MSKKTQIDYSNVPSTMFSTSFVEECQQMVKTNWDAEFASYGSAASGMTEELLAHGMMGDSQLTEFIKILDAQGHIKRADRGRMGIRIVPSDIVISNGKAGKVYQPSEEDLKFVSDNIEYGINKMGKVTIDGLVSRCDTLAPDNGWTRETIETCLALLPKYSLERGKVARLGLPSPT